MELDLLVSTGSNTLQDAHLTEIYDLHDETDGDDSEDDQPMVTFVRSKAATKNGTWVDLDDHWSDDRSMRDWDP